MATSVHEVIDAFRKAPSNSERGTRFEQLIQKVATVAVETMKVVDSLVALPALRQGDL
ncbi:hypothetical protein G6038_28990 [Rhodococcus sp. 14C212]|uniref:hypothetical protein n=1 Tax=Rhodococcus sp. 14C212 TaxID=2711209 RepID=UPI0013EBAE22|nr:hypothetical protein [Rhodococcus sp. 14C212]NGP09431.1 hypothetical protein [Rhodococcus sp. 14C212]